MDGPIRSSIEDARGDQAGSSARVNQGLFASAEERLTSRLNEQSALILVVALSLAIWAIVWGVFVGIAFALGSLPGI